MIYCRCVRFANFTVRSLCAFTLAWLSFSCNQDEGTRQTPVANVGVPGSGGETDPSSSQGKGIASSLEMGTLSKQMLFTKEAAENTCVAFSVKTLFDGKPVSDVRVTFEIQVSKGLSDPGSITPADAISDLNGELSATYCSGEDEGQLIILAKSSSLQANSAKISVVKKPVYQFSYLRADVDPILLPSDGSKAEDKVIYLNLLDSGPQDCTHVYFKLSSSGGPIVGESLEFSSQADFPKGAKLSKRSEALQTKIDAISNKKYAVHTAISSGAGEFAVPVCAGVSLGTLVISSQFVDGDGRTYNVKSPVVRITAGLTNYINMSLSFDNMNARTLKAYFNTNSSYELPFSVQLGARYDGNPLIDYPVSIATEVGRVVIQNGGTPSRDTGSVAVKLQSLHLVDNYPFPVMRFNGYPAAQTRCEPLSLAQWGTSQGLSEVKYKDLRANWRSTMTYSVRGQEHYYDANRNGFYDVGGDGFWDKNQNGIFDSTDVLTYDAGNDSLFNPQSEWFIDLPSPFVDVDENGVFDASKDILIGDEYQAPSGKRESDALLWKAEYFPVSMGASVYGLQRYRINTAAYQSADNPVALPGGSSYEVFGLLGLDSSDFWAGGTVTAAGSSYSSILFAHDLCGNLLPGGTELSLSFHETHRPVWGARNPTAHFYIQPGDIYLETARHLLRDADGGASAKINFNATDHAAGDSGYPVLNSIEVPPCVNSCSGAVVAGNPGLSCDGWSGSVKFSVKEPKLDAQGVSSNIGFEVPLSFSSYHACNCIATAVETAGVCECPTGKTLTAGACI